MKKGGIFSADFLKVLIPSLLISHLLALGLGYARFTLGGYGGGRLKLR